MLEVLLYRSNNSKIHIDSFKRKGEGPDPDWYTYPEIAERYGFTKDQISYTLKSYDIKTEKRGKFTMIYRTDFDKVAAKRLAGAERVQHVDGTESIPLLCKPNLKKGHALPLQMGIIQQKRWLPLPQVEEYHPRSPRSRGIQLTPNHLMQPSHYSGNSV